MLDAIARVCALLLTVVLAWSFGAKVVRFRRWRRALARYRLGRLETAASVGVPLAEVAAAALFVVGRWRVAGALVIALLSAFSLAIARVSASGGDKVPCGCFGRDTAREPRVLIARNGLLAGLAAIVLLGLGRDPGAGSATTLESALPAALVVLGALLIAWMTWQVASALRRRA